MDKIAAYSVVLAAHPLWMQKEAVTVEDLYRKTTSAPNVHITSDKSDIAHALPTRGQYLHKARTSPKAKRLKSMSEAYLNTVGALPGGVGDELRRQYNTTFAKQLTSDPRPAAEVGKISINPTNVSNLFGRMGTQMGSQMPSPDGQRALTGLTLSHELAERRTAPRDFGEFRSHASPDVLLKERNALARIEGPGAAEAKELISKVRESSGETDHIRRLLTTTYGDRAAQFLEGDQKVSKAMRKNLLRKLRENPKLIEETASAPGFMGKVNQTKRKLIHASRMLRV